LVRVIYHFILFLSINQSKHSKHSQITSDERVTIIQKKIYNNIHKGIDIVFIHSFQHLYGLFGRCTVPNTSYAIRGTCTNQMAIKETHGHKQKFVEEIDYDEIEKLEVHNLYKYINV